MNTKRNAAVAALIVIVAALFWWSARGRSPETERAGRIVEAAAPKPVAVRVMTVHLSTAPQTLDATGTVQAELTAPVATKVQGRVMRVFVQEGDYVRKGQPLVQLDARDLDAAVNQAQAGVRSAEVGYDNAVVAARMEKSMSQARIAEAQAALANAKAALQAARAQQQLVAAGPRRQEKTQAALGVTQAQSNLTLAENNLKRMKSLYEQGAIAHQQLDIYQSQYEVAKAQYESAVQSQSIAEEGSRAEDIRKANEAVLQAQAGVAQAQAGLKQAKAAALQADVRAQQVRGAQAQIGQGQAALDMAQVTRDYATINAPFDGVVTQRSVDPGALASPGVPLLTLQGGPLRLHAIVPESALSAVRTGQIVPVDLDAIPDKTFTGRVVEVAPQGDASSHTFLVKVNLPESAGIRSGMFGRAAFRTGSERRMLVPKSAIEEREGLSYIYVADGDVARMRLVTAGDPANGYVPILSGLNEGANVITNANAVSDGTSITTGGRLVSEASAGAEGR